MGTVSNCFEFTVGQRFIDSINPIRKKRYWPWGHGDSNLVKLQRFIKNFQPFGN
jgi:hypothetical protein